MSLYVGNLDPVCSEATLYKTFSSIGPVYSIRVCRELKSGYPLGYGYVNFIHEEDAKKAITTLNYQQVNGRALRIMIADKFMSKKYSQSSNVFIKNLDETIDDKALRDIFIAFGRIASLKVAVDIHGHSKGYGYVQFETEESADEAIKKLNEKLIKGKQVYVSKYIPRNERKLLDFKNVYFKNFPRHFTSDDLEELCNDFGTIVSAKVMMNEDGKSKGFGFVAFTSSESAKEAVAELNGKIINGDKLFAGRAKKKSERQAEVVSQFKDKLKDISNSD